MGEIDDGCKLSLQFYVPATPGCVRTHLELLFRFLLLPWTSTLHRHAMFGLHPIEQINPASSPLEHARIQNKKQISHIQTSIFFLRILRPYFSYFGHWYPLANFHFTSFDFSSSRHRGLSYTGFFTLFLNHIAHGVSCPPLRFTIPPPACVGHSSTRLNFLLFFSL